ncbi:hypothetical protein P7H94_12940 [Lactococcus lactis]|uniref:hypothetical protein n=1 Tax=Lactococcus lactis TaxID=1358 RepID=UPI00288D3E15|nr:hypothetical protein [Lactococcus lactis]MDT2879694.1 hypothetical protein [Lactococcus lactis]MDT2885315.1 hypothetical protein [Lactococcus lactis]MDT2896059.1 hypothetical protein [Lactococcus lactis]MDT2922814.1 hypothetical protein [Lactococcus lactis]
MKKTLISVFAFTSLVTVSLVSLKFRLKPPKKEFFNFDEPLKEEEQEVLDEYKQSIEIQENKQLKNDTKNKIEEIQHQVELLYALQKKFPLDPDQFEKRIMDSYDAGLRIALGYAIKAIDTTQLFIDRPLKKLTLDRPSMVLSSISANVKEIASHLSIYDSSYPLKMQYCIKDIFAELNCSLKFLQGAEAEGMLLTPSSTEASQFEFHDKRLDSVEKKDERVTIIGNNEGGQQEFVEPKILKNISPEPIAAYDDILSNHLKIEDIPLEYRSRDVYSLSFRYARGHSIERYVEICRILLDDIESFGDKSPMTKGQGIQLLASYFINGFDYFKDNKALVDFAVEKQKALADIGIVHEFSKEKNRIVENEEADFFSKKAKMILSNKEDSNKAEIKVLGYIIRQVIQAHEQGDDFIVFKNFKYFKKQRHSYLYLVEHADEIEQSQNILRVVVTGIYVAIYFERNKI